MSGDSLVLIIRVEKYLGHELDGDARRNLIEWRASNPTIPLHEWIVWYANRPELDRESRLRWRGSRPGVT